MPSSQVSRKALIISGSAVRSSPLPSFTSRLFTNGWKFEPYLIRTAGRSRPSAHGPPCLPSPAANSDEEAVARNHPVAPAMRVLVELNGFAQWRVFRPRAEQGHLFVVVAVLFANGFENGAGRCARGPAARRPALRSWFAQPSRPIAGSDRCADRKPRSASFFSGPCRA